MFNIRTLDTAPCDRCAIVSRTGIVGALPRLRIVIIERVDSRSVQHFCVRFPIGGVTTAGGRFESAAVQDFDFTAVIFYQPAALQYAGSRRDADAADTEHVREEFMGDVKTT